MIVMVVLVIRWHLKGNFMTFFQSQSLHVPVLLCHVRQRTGERMIMVRTIIHLHKAHQHPISWIGGRGVRSQPGALKGEKKEPAKQTAQPDDDHGDKKETNDGIDARGQT